MSFLSTVFEPTVDWLQVSCVLAVVAAGIFAFLSIKIPSLYCWRELAGAIALVVTGAYAIWTLMDNPSDPNPGSTLAYILIAICLVVMVLGMVAEALGRKGKPPAPTPWI